MSEAEAQRPRLEVAMTMAPNRIYVERPEDEILENRIRSGAWTNVVAPRTMGKSSMFSRILRKLRDEGFPVAWVDIADSATEQTQKTEDPMLLFERIISSMDRSFYFKQRRDGSKGQLPSEKLEKIENEEPQDDDKKLWSLMQPVLEKIGKENEPTKKIIICFNEVQYLRSLPCGSRFVEAMNEVTEQISASEWGERVVFCFIGWEAFGKFAPDSARFITEKAKIVELKDWRIDDEKTIDVLIQALQISDDARAAVRIALELSGGQPQTTCIVLDHIRQCAELSDPATSYTDAAKKVANARISDIDYGFRMLLATIERSDSAVQSLKKLLHTQDGTQEYENMPEGMDVLLMAGVVRKKGNIYEVKSPLLLQWFRERIE